MSHFRVARRYAEALLALAKDEKKIDAVAGDLRQIQRVVEEAPDFSLLLRSPVIKKEKKLAVFQEAFKKKISPMTLGFLTLLTEKGREETLPEVIAQFFRLQDIEQGVVAVDVAAAAEMTEKQKNALIKKFEGMTSKKVRLNVSVDETLRGGLVARVDDTVYDGSLRHQLDLVRKRLAGV